MSTPRELADRFHARWLRIHPFAATMYGIPGYDDLMPDDSAEGQQAWRAEAGRFLDEARAIERGTARRGRRGDARLRDRGGRAGGGAASTWPRTSTP